VRAQAAESTACSTATTPEELAGHFAVRHRVFVVEQAIFAQSDRDGLDSVATTIHLVGSSGGRVVGAVRLYPVAEPSGHWVGDRLAVAPGFRIHQLGSDLVRLAVATARAHAGREMMAHIQVPNVRFFERLGWRIDGPAEVYHGRPHQPMAIDLTHRDG